MKMLFVLVLGLCSGASTRLDPAGSSSIDDQNAHRWTHTLGCSFNLNPHQISSENGLIAPELLFANGPKVIKSPLSISGEVGYPFDSGSHKMLWSRESIYQEANPEVTALARRGAA